MGLAFKFIYNNISSILNPPMVFRKNSKQNECESETHKTGTTVYVQYIFIAKI
jgi:hypothetical protein